MNMSGSSHVRASSDTVWSALFDPRVLKQCIPGCERLEQTADGEYDAAVAVKIGPVKARFQGKVTISDAIPGESCRIIGEGSGGMAGFAKGAAAVILREQDDGTTIDYHVESQIGGKLAQLGARMINATTTRMADDFFAAFANAIADSQKSHAGRDATFSRKNS